MTTTLHISLGAPEGLVESYRQSRLGVASLGLAPTDEPVLYLQSTGVLQLTIRGGYQIGGWSGDVTFKEELNAYDASRTLQGTLYTTFHRSTLAEYAHADLFSYDERMLLNLLAENAVNESYYEKAAHQVLWVALVHDPTLREPLKTRFPDFWQMWGDRIKRQEVQRKIEATLWTLLEAYPEFRGEVPTACDVARNDLHGDSQKLVHQAAFLREQLKRLRKHAPPIYIRILRAAVEVMEKEAEGLEKAVVGAEVLEKLQKAQG